MSLSAWGAGTLARLFAVAFLRKYAVFHANARPPHGGLRAFSETNQKLLFHD
jgi:hypothetical protein